MPVRQDRSARQSVAEAPGRLPPETTKAARHARVHHHPVVVVGIPNKIVIHQDGAKSVDARRDGERGRRTEQTHVRGTKRTRSPPRGTRRARWFASASEVFLLGRAFGWLGSGQRIAP